MPLFICNKCGCIENSHLVNKNLLETKYNYRNMIPGEMVPEFYPCMDLRDMHGHGESNILLNGQIWKDVKETRMLCSECNTGTWHGEFTKSFPSEKTKILSLFSKNGFITPYDQDDISYNRSDDNEECDYEPNLQYYYILKLYRKMIGDENFKGSILKDLKRRSNEIVPSTETFKEFLKYGNFILFFDMMKEEEDNFHVTLQGDIRDDEDIDWSDTREIALMLLDSVIDENKTKGLWKTLWSYHNQEDEVLRQKIFEYKTFKKPSNNMVSNISHGIHNNTMSMLHNLNLNKFNQKPHWKDIQSPDEKEKKLKLAEEKRQRKLNRKNNG